MLTTILIILVILIFILSIIKIVLDFKRKKPTGFIIKEGIFLLLLIVALLVIDIKFLKQANIPESEEEEQAAQVEEKPRLESDPVKMLLAQLLDYVDGLDKSDKPQLTLFFKQGMEYRAKEDYSNALESFRQGLQLKLKDSEKIALYILMGNSSAFLKEYDNAIDSYDLAVDLSEDTKNDGALVASLANLALIFQIQENWDKAKQT
jgi:tetratricopeptide (TPR) repeat protein